MSSLKHALLIAGLFCAALIGVQILPAGEQPNVILIITDDQGYGDLSCHGNPILKTPHLDKLHEQSARFTDFHVIPCAPPPALP